MIKTTMRLSPAFKKAYSSEKRYRILYGGAGSGKSHYVAQETLLKVLQYDGFRYLIVRKTNRSLRNSVFRLLCDLISEYNLSECFEIHKSDMSFRSLITRSEIITSGLDDVEKLKSIANVNRIWVEEATEITEPDFNQLDLRLRGRSEHKHQMTLTLNPISELHWIKKRFFDRREKNGMNLRTTYEDNPFLDDQYKATLEELVNLDPNYYRVYAKGMWGQVGNLIFKNWKIEEGLKDKEEELDGFLYHGLDFGFSSDPAAYVKCKLDYDNKKLYVLQALGGTDLSNENIADLIRPHVRDDILFCDSAEPKSIADLARLKVRAIPADKGKGSIEYGIRFLQDLEIVVDDKAQNIINELGSYSWKKDPTGMSIAIPQDKNNHWIDALRYALCKVNGRRINNKPKRVKYNFESEKPNQGHRSFVGGEITQSYIDGGW